jgi:hypothetical protein
VWYNGSTTAFQAVDKGSIPFTRIMKMYNNFKIWFGKKLIDLGFGILLSMDDRYWNPTKECYSGSIKQFKYNVGSWLVKHGIRIEAKNLHKAGWPGFTEYKYYDRNFHLGNNPYTQKFKKKKKRNNDDGPDFGNLFKDWQ